MKIEETSLKDALVITPVVYTDDRGYFLESYNKSKLENSLQVEFVQDNESLSQKDVLRGLHFQKPPYAQDKLVRVILGSVLDVIVDLRNGSATYGKHYKIILSAENKKQLFVPKGFAHGFLVLEDHTIFSYKCSNYYHQASEVSLDWNDTHFGIDWGIDNPNLSEKDKNAQNFANFTTPF